MLDDQEVKERVKEITAVQHVCACHFSVSADDIGDERVSQALTRSMESLNHSIPKLVQQAVRQANIGLLTADQVREMEEKE